MGDKKKLLIVDDDASFAKNVKSFFTMKGYDVFIAHNGKEGLDMCEKITPDIVLLDVIMPEIDGYTMLKNLREAQISVPVVMITGKANLQALFEVEDVAAFFTKGCDLETIGYKVDDLLRDT